MAERAPSEILRAIHRLSLALQHCDGLTPFEKRELEGALYALAWVQGQIIADPTDWMLPTAIRERVDAMIRELLDGQAPAPVVATTETVRRGEAAGRFIERSQPREAD